MGFDIFILKILIFGLFAVLVLWLLILLRQVPESESQALEIYTVKDGRVLVYDAKRWREKNGIRP